MSDEHLYVFKVIICGPEGSGKTSLVRRFTDGTFQKDTKATIGVDFSLKYVELKHENTNAKFALQIWDFAGEKKFRSVLPHYIKGTKGIILAFPVNEPESLNDLYEWLKVIRQYLEEDIPICVTLSKNDLLDDSSGVIDKLNEFMVKNNLTEQLPTSALSGENVGALFEKITKLILENVND